MHDQEKRSVHADVRKSKRPTKMLLCNLALALRQIRLASIELRSRYFGGLTLSYRANLLLVTIRFQIVRDLRGAVEHIRYCMWRV